MPGRSAKSAEGSGVAERPIKVADLMATILQGLGINPAKQLRGKGDRPIGIVDKDFEVVKELFS